MWARESREADGSRPGVGESLRWIEGYERLAEMAPRLPTTRLVYLADREADIMALMVRARDLGAPLDWLLRCKHNRTLSGGGLLPGLAVFLRERAMASRQSRPSGWACSAFLTSPLASGFLASFRLRGLVYNEMPQGHSGQCLSNLPAAHSGALVQ